MFCCIFCLSSLFIVKGSYFHMGVSVFVPNRVTYDYDHASWFQDTATAISLYYL